ncbi:MFS transporter [Ectothiorhodospira variabilis]|uniref:MFS transporter n=1 Tax=Ectothiorhodospira variabilis TaxID=505694 RepID=UPI001EFA2B6B|nr:MFS transporter [Ectothiorhodospira variabilis]MCG5493364.1 MFS transporter [Ectothiorhodospira variabilis]MCG5496710.1 MFS transporter [Ectothiorhodospira variabilis]MCG5502693.1 MFS transporter [Ectothiorhodospira variabilis]MCG5505541.1 MFS transporter [Ectothiorhodospira variabilis]
MKRASFKEIFGWAMFDFANQAYTLLIITVIFGDLFTRVIVGDSETDYRLGNLLWSVALAVSYLMVVLVGPVAGAIMDFSAARKRFLFASYVLTVVTTGLLYFVAPGYIWLGMLLIICSNFAYAIGESFIASFLPELGPREQLGWISGFGWALGYVGGLVATAFALVMLGEVSEENFDRIRWVGPFAAVFFLLAAIPTFLWLRERGRARRLKGGVRSYLGIGFRRVRATIKDLRHYRDLATLLVSIFFAMAGIYIIISFTFIYGAQVIQWDEQVRIWMFVTVQLTAAAGALGFGFLQDRIGARTTYLATLVLWIVAVTLIFSTPWLGRVVPMEAQHVFLIVGSVAGLCLGSTQSAGRALVGVLAPRLRAAEFFGFWGLASKLAAIVGLLGLGLLQVAVGLHASILFCALLFALALVVALGLNEARGRRVAEEREAPRSSILP